MTDLNKLANQVTDEKSLISFIRALAKDRTDEVAKEKKKPSSAYASGASGWENSTIEQFLECAAAWTEDTGNGATGYTKPSNPWTRFAQILLMGKLYE